MTKVSNRDRKYKKFLLLLLLLVVMAMPGHTVTAICMSSNVVCQWLGVAS